LRGAELTQTFVMKKPRAARTPQQLSNLEREPRELKQVVEALAVRSVVHDHEVQVVDFEGLHQALTNVRRRSDQRRRIAERYFFAEKR
jgi:hypothetical protein